MAMNATYLADTSAWHWASAIPKKWRKLLEEKQIATCGIVELEYLQSAISKRDLLQSAYERGLLARAQINEGDIQRAEEVMLELGKKQELGHRSVKLPDLLVAAAAESAKLTVLHYDRDFDRIAGVTGQRTEWLAKKGSLKR